MCTDYRKVYNLSKTDTFPIPRIDDYIDKIGNSKYITKFDILKGFWQIPLTERAKEISAFVTPDGLYHYKIMPFGMKNSPATFQRLINTIIAGIEHCEAYTSSWDLGRAAVCVCGTPWTFLLPFFCFTSMMPSYTMMSGITNRGLSKHSLIN